MKTITNLAQKGLIALLVFMTLIVLVTWLFKFDDSSPYNARAQTIVNAAVVVTSTVPVVPVSATPESGYPGPIATATSVLATPSPTIEIGVDDLPPIEHGHRHFERPSQPIMPTATMMPVSTEQPQPTVTSTVEPFDTTGISPDASVLVGDSLQWKFYLPIALVLPYRTVKVFAVAYMDTPVTPQSINNLHSQLVADLSFGSEWHAYQQSMSPPAFTYVTHPSGVVKLSAPPPHRPSGLFDYDAVYQRFNLCAKIQNHEVDEVWIWESGEQGTGQSS